MKYSLAAVIGLVAGVAFGGLGDLIPNYMQVPTLGGGSGWTPNDLGGSQKVLIEPWELSSLYTTTNMTANSVVGGSVAVVLNRATAATNAYVTTYYASPATAYALGPVVEHDGSRYYISFPSTNCLSLRYLPTKNLSLGDYTTANEATNDVFFIVWSRSIAENAIILASYKATSFAYAQNSDTFYMGGQTATVAFPTNYAPAMRCGVVEGTNAYIFANGTNMARVAKDAQVGGAVVLRGSGAATRRLYGLFLAKTNGLSETDRQKLEGYFAHKTATTHLLDVDHPYKSAPP